MTYSLAPWAAYLLLGFGAFGLLLIIIVLLTARYNAALTDHTTKGAE